MNKSQLKGRETRFRNFYKIMDTDATYEKQRKRIKKGQYVDTRKRID